MDSDKNVLDDWDHNAPQRFTTSFDELIQKDDLDAILICSPTDTHAQHVIAAAQAGIHIFCEKPLDLSLGKVLEVLEIVKQNKVQLMLGFNRRFDKEFRKAHDMIKKGAIGNIRLIKIASRDPQAPPINYIKQSGGIFLDMTIHDFDMARYICGKEVVEVYAKGTAFNSEIKPTGDIDTAVTTLIFEDDSMAIIDNSRECSYGYDQRIEIFGSKGMIQVNNNFHNSNKLFTKEGVRGSLPLNFFIDRYKKAYQAEVQKFINCIVHKKSIPVNGFDGLVSLKIGLAAQKSLIENRPVRVDEIS